MRHVADESESMACANYLRPKWGKPVMSNGAGLEIADVVGRVVHKLDMPDPTPMRFLKPFQLPLKKIQPFNVSHEGRVARGMCGLQIRCRKRAAQPMVSDQLIYPIKAV